MTHERLLTARALAALGAALLAVAAVAPWWESAQGTLGFAGRFVRVDRGPTAGGPAAPRQSGVDRAHFSRGLVFTRFCRLRRGSWSCEWGRMVRAMGSSYRLWVGLGRATAALALWAALLAVAGAFLARRPGPWLKRVLWGTLLSAPLASLGGILWLGPLRPDLLRPAEMGAGLFLCLAGTLATLASALLLRKGTGSAHSTD